LNRQLGFVALCGLLCGTALASVAELRNSWNNPSTQPIDLSSSRMAVVFMTPDPGRRREAEEMLAQKLGRYGIQAVPAESILPAKRGGDATTMRERLADAGIDTVLIMRVLGEGASLSVSPPPYLLSPQPWEYRSLLQYWGYGWGRVLSPGYLLTDTAISMETLLYSLPQDRLLWASRSSSSHRYQIAELTAQLADVVPVQMARDGVFKR
jgi:hypothetical protein